MHPKNSGIIYCLTKQECEDVSKELQKMQINSSHFHAGMSNQQRIKIHEAWLVDEIQVIVATVAFGMGINKQDCRFVIHFQMPKSIENYYQESGRAGRDGKISHCLLFYNDSDVKTNMNLI